jgi:histidine kinase
MPAPLHRLLVNIDLAADHMATLVADLLELTGLQAGRVRLEPVQTDLRTLARHAAREIEPLAQTRRQRLALRLPRRPVPALVDSGRLERALLNLLSNACKYSPDNSTISLGLERHGDEAVFSVADEGPGVPVADRQRIFQRFYRPDTPATRQAPGSGLGLAIARAMVELHGGRIWVESALGQGSVFRFAVPVRAASRARPNGQLAQASTTPTVTLAVTAAGLGTKLV